jgi:hypothetical protein
MTLGTRAALVAIARARDSADGAQKAARTTTLPVGSFDHPGIYRKRGQIYFPPLRSRKINLTPFLYFPGTGARNCV